jgi:hypothetical protein
MSRRKVKDSCFGGAKGIRTPELNMGYNMPNYTRETAGHLNDCVNIFATTKIWCELTLNEVNFKIKPREEEHINNILATG